MTNKEPEMYERCEASPLVEPGLSPLWQQRLKDLADHIARDLALLKEYEDALRYEDDPRRRARYLREIEQLHESVARHKQEYDELAAQVAGRPPVVMQDVAAKLQQMDGKLEMRRLRQRLVARYKAHEQRVVAIHVERLDQAHLDTVQAILDALEADRVTDALMCQALDAVQRLLVALSERGIALPGHQAVADAVIAPTLGVKHKLKLTLPIIPTLLSYEGELELGSETGLATAWRQLVTKVRGAPPPVGCKARIRKLPAAVQVMIVAVLLAIAGLCVVVGRPVAEQRIVGMFSKPTPTARAVHLTDAHIRFTVTLSNGSKWEVPAGGVLSLSPDDRVLIEVNVAVDHWLFPRDLTYQYFALEGSIPQELTGPTASYSAPDNPGADIIAVRIRDQETGDEIVRSVNVEVKEQLP